MLATRALQLTRVLTARQLRLTRTALLAPAARSGASNKVAVEIAPRSTMSRDDQIREPTQHARDGKISLAGHEVEGISIAGQETCIIFPSADIVFDSGRCPQRSVYRRNLFITHEHLDHMGGIPFHICTRQMLSLSKTHLFVPDFISQPVNALLDAYRAFQRCEMPCEVTPMQIGQEYQLGRFLVKPFKTYHTVPSQGYLLRSQRNKLKAEYHGLPGQEIAAAKKRGEVN
ncbi:TPA: hypothetical protein ACH3X2_000535 [Trebouxia sp. C0005]